MPELIYELIKSECFGILARVVLTSFFWTSAIFGIFGFAMMVKEIESNNLPAPRVLAAMVIVTELGGSALLVSNYHSLGWLGAGALGVFTLLSIPLGHAFWKYDQPKRMAEFQIAMEHIGVTGGLMCAAVVTLPLCQ